MNIELRAIAGLTYPLVNPRLQARCGVPRRHAGTDAGHRPLPVDVPVPGHPPRRVRQRRSACERGTRRLDSSRRVPHQTWRSHDTSSTHTVRTPSRSCSTSAATSAPWSSTPSPRARHRDRDQPRGRRRRPLPQGGAEPARRRPAGLRRRVRPAGRRPLHAVGQDVALAGASRSPAASVTELDWCGAELPVRPPRGPPRALIDDAGTALHTRSTPRRVAAPVGVRRGRRRAARRRLGPLPVLLGPLPAARRAGRSPRTRSGCGTRSTPTTSPRSTTRPASCCSRASGRWAWASSSRSATRRSSSRWPPASRSPPRTVNAQIPAFQRLRRLRRRGRLGHVPVDHRHPQPGGPDRHRPHLPRDARRRATTASGSRTGCSSGG